MLPFISECLSHIIDVTMYQCIASFYMLNYINYLYMVWRVAEIRFPGKGAKRQSVRQGGMGQQRDMESPIADDGDRKN